MGPNFGPKNSRKKNTEPVHTRSLIRAFASRFKVEYSMSIKLLTAHHLESLSLKGGCTSSSESIHLSKCHIVGNHMSRLRYSCTLALVY